MVTAANFWPVFAFNFNLRSTYGLITSPVDENVLYSGQYFNSHNGQFMDKVTVLSHLALSWLFGHSSHAHFPQSG